MESMHSSKNIYMPDLESEQWGIKKKNGQDPDTSETWDRVGPWNKHTNSDGTRPQAFRATAGECVMCSGALVKCKGRLFSLFGAWSSNQEMFRQLNITAYVLLPLFDLWQLKQWTLSSDSSCMGSVCAKGGICSRWWPSSPSHPFIYGYQISIRSWSWPQWEKKRKKPRKQKPVVIGRLSRWSLWTLRWAFTPLYNPLFMSVNVACDFFLTNRI